MYLREDRTIGTHFLHIQYNIVRNEVKADNSRHNRKVALLGTLLQEIS